MASSAAKLTPSTPNRTPSIARMRVESEQSGLSDKTKRTLSALSNISSKTDKAEQRKEFKTLLDVGGEKSSGDNIENVLSAIAELIAKVNELASKSQTAPGDQKKESANNANNNPSTVAELEKQLQETQQKLAQVLAAQAQEKQAQQQQAPLSAARDSKAQDDSSDKLKLKEAQATIKELELKITQLGSQQPTKAESTEKKPAAAPDEKKDSLELLNKKIAEYEKNKEDDQKRQQAKIAFLKKNLEVNDELAKAKATLEYHQETLTNVLNQLEQNFYFFLQQQAESKGVIASEKKILDQDKISFTAIINQYRDLLAQIAILAKAKQNANDAVCLQAYAKTLELACDALNNIGKGEFEDKKKAFINHIVSLPANHPLSRSEILVGIGLALVGLLIVSGPLALVLGSLLKMTVAASVAETIVGTLGIAEITSQVAALSMGVSSLIAGISFAKAYGTFFGSRPEAQAHPIQHLHHMGHTMQQYGTTQRQNFKKVKGLIS